MFPTGLEPAAFRVLGGRDNHYTTETTMSLSQSLKEPSTNHLRDVLYAF